MRELLPQQRQKVAGGTAYVHDHAALPASRQAEPALQPAGGMHTRGAIYVVVVTRFRLVNFGQLLAPGERARGVGQNRDGVPVNQKSASRPYGGCGTTGRRREIE